MYKVSIVIVNYKTKQLTTNCIDSIIKYCKYPYFEIILVENGTGEFSEETVSKWNGLVRLVVLDKNLGFSGGNNKGIEKASGDYILLLNSDTYLIEDAISPIIAYLQRNKKIGVVSAQLIYPDGRIQSVAQRFPSVRYKLIELLRIQKLMSPIRAGRLLLGSFFDHQKSLKVDWVWGAYFMFPRKILQRLPNQQLDESYFMYYEDMQWCMDITKMGYEIHFCADAKVVHLHGGSSGRKNELMEISGQMFMNKNYSKFEILAIKLLDRCLKN